MSFSSKRQRDNKRNHNHNKHYHSEACISSDDESDLSSHDDLSLLGRSSRPNGRLFLRKPTSLLGRSWRQSRLRLSSRSRSRSRSSSRSSSRSRSRSRSSSRSPVKTENGLKYYEVEEVKEYNLENRLYKVKWVGYTHNTWEPLSCLTTKARWSVLQFWTKVSRNDYERHYDIRLKPKIIGYIDLTQ